MCRSMRGPKGVGMIMEMSGGRDKGMDKGERGRIGGIRLIED